MEAAHGAHPLQHCLRPGAKHDADPEGRGLHGERGERAMRENGMPRHKELDGDFAAVLWAGFGDDERYNRQNLALLRRLGIDAITYTGANVREMCARANMRLLWNPDRVTGQSGEDFCKPQILERWRTLYRESAQALAPLALTFGDETQYDWRSDGSVITSGPAYRDQDFRVFLGQLFDNPGGKLDLSVLNKAWGTAFHFESESRCARLTSCGQPTRRRNGCREALWTEWQFHRLLAESKTAAEAEAPLSYYGDEGVCNIFTGDGHDYYQQGKDMTLYQCSRREQGAVSRPVFCPDRMRLRGLWTGNYSYFNGAVDEEWMRSRLALALLWHEFRMVVECKACPSAPTENLSPALRNTVQRCGTSKTVPPRRGYCHA